jgi:N-acetylmuramoyl-L-alanine amidase
VRTRRAALAALALGLSLPAQARYESPSLGRAAPRSKPAAVFVDPGHGGDDLGAVVAGRREKDIALAIARKLKQKLEALNGTAVRLTRDSDVYIPLDKRVEESLDPGNLAFVSLHINQVRSKKPHGITVYAFGKTTFRGGSRRRHKIPPLPAPSKESARASGRLASSIVESLRAQGFRVDPPAKAGFYVLKNPTVPSVLIELGFLSNPQEAALLADPAYQDKLADAVAVSLQSYFLASVEGAPAAPHQLVSTAPSR